MAVFLFMGLIFLPLALLWAPFIYLSAVGFGLLLVSMAPFTVRTLFQDPLVGIISPGMMLLRTSMFVAGLCAGFVYYLRKGKTR